MEQVILEQEALKLPAHERALLADALLGSLDDEAVRNAETACAQETEDRYQGFLRGEVEAVDGPTVLRQLRAQHGK